MADVSQSQIKINQLMGTNPDGSIQVIKSVNRPNIKQFSVLSKRSTTKIKPNLYTVKMELDTPKITPTSKVKISCSCSDFRYRQAWAFSQKDALLSSEDYLLKMNGQEVRADRTNPQGIIKACKHIRVAIAYALQRGI